MSTTSLFHRATARARHAQHKAYASAALLVLAAAAGCSVAPPRTATTVARTPASITPASATTLAPQEPTPRQIIRRGSVDVTVEQVDSARRRLQRAADALGAQVARLDANEETHAAIVFRVPPERLDALMDSAAALGKVDSRTVSAEDVTDAVVDVEGRLASLRASRDRLRALLDRAAAVPDVITVERELARVQGEIESLEGRLATLRGQVALSELTVDIGRRHVLGPLGALFVGLGTVLGKLFVIR